MTGTNMMVSSADFFRFMGPMASATEQVAGSVFFFLNKAMVYCPFRGKLNTLLGGGIDE
jgi:hypothetical protein